MGSWGLSGLRDEAPLFKISLVGRPLEEAVMRKNQVSSRVNRNLYSPLHFWAHQGRFNTFSFSLWKNPCEVGFIHYQLYFIEGKTESQAGKLDKGKEWVTGKGQGKFSPLENSVLGTWARHQPGGLSTGVGAGGWGSWRRREGRTRPRPSSTWVLPARGSSHLHTRALGAPGCNLDLGFPGKAGLFHQALAFPRWGSRCSRDFFPLCNR